jgi:hypothetical protein
MNRSTDPLITDPLITDPRQHNNPVEYCTGSHPSLTTTNRHAMPKPAPIRTDNCPSCSHPILMPTGTHQVSKGILRGAVRARIMIFDKRRGEPTATPSRRARSRVLSGRERCGEPCLALEGRSFFEGGPLTRGIKLGMARRPPFPFHPIPIAFPCFTTLSQDPPPTLAQSDYL